MEENEKTKRADEVARQILSYSRNLLLVNMRFLDSALSRLEYFKNDSGITLATDGKHLIYDPMHVLKRFKSGKTLMNRDYLHIIMHCIFRHMFVNSLINIPAWDLACDIAVEYVITDLNLASLDTGVSNSQSAVFSQLMKKAGGMTAERLYKLFLDEAIPESTLIKMREKFVSDDHSVWYMTDGMKAELGLPNGSGDGENDDGQNGEGSEADWTSISEHIQVDMETFQTGRGTAPGSFMQNLRELNREKYDYAEFLKKFAVRTEVMKVNPDEFDYVYYTYGLRLYEKMPLIEPLEYKEDKRIKDFVIAIDTSGSVSGDLVQTFLQKTFNIMKQTENFASRINLYIIQCDAWIQEAVKITDQREFDEYISHMTIKGLGGTDFRPVFGFVNRMIEEKQFTDLKGIIYFTDGFGTYPSKKPDYDAAFVFIEDNYYDRDVPPWAIKLILRKEDIENI